MTGQSVTLNPNYWVSVSRGGSQIGGNNGRGIAGSLSVVANAAAKLSIQVENRWVNVLEALGISSDGAGGVASSAYGAFQLASGEYLSPVVLTSHIWRGSSGIELTLEMRFDAWDDAARDVILPVKTLISMFSPKRSGGDGQSALEKFGNWAGGLVGNANVGNSIGRMIAGQFLEPPGPTPTSYAKSVYNGTSDPMAITVLIGGVLCIGNLIPTTLKWEFENRFTKDGDPIAAVVSASFISYTVPALDDILKFFLNRTGTDTLESIVGIGSASSNPNATPSPVATDLSTSTPNGNQATGNAVTPPIT